MAAKKYLFNTGDRCTDITGDWHASTKLNTSSAASQSGSLKFESTNMTASIAYGTKQAIGKILTKQKINVTDFSKLCFDCSYFEDDSTNDLDAVLGLFDSLEVTASTAKAGVKVSSDATRRVYEIDVSNISGSYYVGVWMGRSNHSGSARTVFYNVYLEAESYDLAANLDDGSTVSVYRSHATTGKTGNVSVGSDVLQRGDILKITFSPKSNYKILTNKVNGSTFVSGNTLTVKNNVNIQATSQPLASSIGATDAKIESTSVITVTRYNDAYSHTVSYSFGKLNGVIVEKSNNSSIAWNIPEEFYYEIPDSKTGTCTLRCDTYHGSSLIGSSSCTLKVTVNYEVCIPTVSGAVEDINPTTVSLTGDSSSIVRFESIVRCVLTATGKYGASIVSKTINGIKVDGDGMVGFSGDIPTSYTFTVEDSRGYIIEKVIYPTVIPYIKLTINPVLERPSPTTGDVTLSFNGNYYNGSFGLHDNTLSVRYRYRESGETSYGSWTVVPSTQYVLGQKTYKTNNTISLANQFGQQFDYKKSYVFQVQAYDGVNGEYLIRATSTITVKKGETIFDWGENDFAFRVPVSVNNNQIKDLADPTGNGDAVPYKYMCDYISDYVTGYVPNYVSTHGFEPDLLWKNASPASMFVGQTVSISLSKYRWIIVEYRFSVDNAGHRTMIIPVGTGEYFALEVVAPSNNRVGSRAVTVTNTSVKFNDTTYNMSENNDYVIPVRVYGLRGVSE